MIQEIGQVFGLHPLVMEDILNTGQRPKLEEFNKLFARHIANMKKMVIKLQNDHPMNVDSRPDFHATDVDGNDTHYNGHYEFFA